MRQAPPVSVLCQGRGWRKAQAGLYTLAAAVFALWLAQHLEASTLLAAACALLAATVTAATVWPMLACAPVELRWDGQQWLADGQAVQLDLMHLNTRTALLRLRTDAGTRWLAVGPADAGAAWHGLRVALLATPGLVESTGAEGRAG